MPDLPLVAKIEWIIRFLKSAYAIYRKDRDFEKIWAEVCRTLPAQRRRKR